VSKPARVDVYRNLHTGLWSIRHRGRVVMHASRVLLRDVRFVVSEAGRQRALRTGQRNVHAVARGVVAALEGPRPAALADRVTYNPFRGPDFVRVATWGTITAADRAFLGPRGGVFVSGT